jgi:hypothetical protein
MRHSFLTKFAAALALIALATFLFYGHWFGATLGLFAACWIVAVAIARPDVRRTGPAWIALGCALGFAIGLVDDPSLLGWVLFWSALATAALLPRCDFRDAIHWAGRLLLHGLVGIARPFRDLRLVARRRYATGTRMLAAVRLLALPVFGGALFLALFANANPVIADAVGMIRLPSLGSVILHLIFWACLLLVIWPSLRPHPLVTFAPPGGPSALSLPNIAPATAILSLATFNAIFTVENAVDIAFLWSGAPLPGSVTLADYAHCGAYTLIATALLAGAFVLVVLRPDSTAARSPWVRRLVVMWVVQNVLLVASSILRTFDYIAAYSLTELRIEALAWMVLVGVGLVLICWRLIAGKSARWLINANALAAVAMLSIASAFDLSAIAASWNVRHARTVGRLDLCYLHTRGASALLPLIDLERRARGAELPDRVAWLRSEAMETVTRDQADWHTWTWRNARRLARAEALLGPAPPRPRAAPNGRTCDGSIIPPPPSAPAPLTGATKR